MWSARILEILFFSDEWKLDIFSWGFLKQEYGDTDFAEKYW